LDIECAASWTGISCTVVIISNKNLPPLGLAHLTVLEVPPLELITLAASIGYAFVGLRLHPAFSGAPFYEIPAGSPEMREMRRRMNGERVWAYDIEFETIDRGFSASRLTSMLESANELGAQRLSVCGEDPELPDSSRPSPSFATWRQPLAWVSIWNAWRGARFPASPKRFCSSKRREGRIAARSSTRSIFREPEVHRPISGTCHPI
jgi:hypothetical protein